jgi:hypothetical protein
LSRLLLIAITFLMGPPPLVDRAAREDEDEHVRRYRGPLPWSTFRVAPDPRSAIHHMAGAIS